MQEYGLLQVQVSNTRHRTDIQRSSHLTIYIFSTLVIASLIPEPRPYRDRHSVALVLTTITMQVGVVNTSVSTYPLLSAY